MFNWTYIGNSSSSDWETMQAQDGRFPSGHFGPEVTFSRELKMQDTTCHFQIYKVGTSIYTIGKRLVTVVIMMI
jgi:hypothetical protein